jgi:hypothetical protein
MFRPFHIRYEMVNTFLHTQHYSTWCVNINVGLLDNKNLIVGLGLKFDTILELGDIGLTQPYKTDL